jgi:hypothetical protein
MVPVHGKGSRIHTWRMGRGVIAISAPRKFRSSKCLFLRRRGCGHVIRRSALGDASRCHAKGDRVDGILLRRCCVASIDRFDDPPTPPPPTHPCLLTCDSGEMACGRTALAVAGGQVEVRSSGKTSPTLITPPEPELNRFLGAFLKLRQKYGAWMTAPRTLAVAAAPYSHCISCCRVFRLLQPFERNQKFVFLVFRSYR